MAESKPVERTAERDMQHLEDVMVVRDLKMHFPVTRGLFKRQVASVKAVDGVSFSIQRGKTLGIVGESGSGKSTVGNCLLRNVDITSGEVYFEGTNMANIKGSALRHLRRSLQMITQDPYASLDPRMNIMSIITEGVRIHHMNSNKQELEDLAVRQLELVGIDPEFRYRYPHEFSGGQRQRISIARALALQPSFIVCDEVVSALDVSIQAQIITLLMDLQEKLGLTYVFIGHDLSVVRHISTQVAVMYLGKFMELTDSEELYSHPLHPYTQALISAAPIPNPTVDRTRERIILQGEIPSPITPPKGCNFCTRCPYATAECFESEPEMVNMGNEHYVACHKVSGAGGKA